MTYKLVSNGRLLDGANESIALQAIAKVARISEQKGRRIFLSGRRVNLSSAPQRETLDKICAFLHKAGVDVEVIEIPDVELDVPPANEATDRPDSSPERVSSQQPTNEPDKKINRTSTLVATFASLLFLIAAAAGYGWHWLYMSESKMLLQAEHALADGNLVAVGYMDIEKLVVLNEHLLGGTDPKALPVSDSKHDLLKRLFTGPANFKDNLKQFIFSVHAAPDEKLTAATMLLAGRFDQQQIVNELNQLFEVAALGDGHWRLIEKPTVLASNDATYLCEKDEEITTAAAAKIVELQLHISPDWLMISSDQAYADNLWQRIISGAGANQDLLRWHSYREGQLAAIMAFLPGQAAKAVTGMPGMIAQGAARQAPNMNGLGAAAAVDIPSAGLNLNFTLYSDNQRWNNETVAEARNKLGEMQADSLSVSPTMAALFSRITMTESNEHIAVDVALDSEIMNDIETLLSR